MAIQPIDLSTMYSQIDKVAQLNASQTHAAHIANKEGIEKATQESLQKSKMVQETQNDATSTKIGQDGGGASASGGGSKKSAKKNGEDNDEGEVKKQWEISDPRLGRHIDITG